MPEAAATAYIISQHTAFSVTRWDVCSVDVKSMGYINPNESRKKSELLTTTGSHHLESHHTTPHHPLDDDLTDRQTDRQTSRKRA